MNYNRHERLERLNNFSTLAEVEAEYALACSRHQEIAQEANGAYERWKRASWHTSRWKDGPKRLYDYACERFEVAYSNHIRLNGFQGIEQNARFYVRDLELRKEALQCKKYGE